MVGFQKVAVSHRVNKKLIKFHRIRERVFHRCCVAGNLHIIFSECQSDKFFRLWNMLGKK